MPLPFLCQQGTGRRHLGPSGTTADLTAPWTAEGQGVPILWGCQNTWNKNSNNVKKNCHWHSNMFNEYFDSLAYKWCDKIPHATLQTNLSITCILIDWHSNVLLGLETRKFSTNVPRCSLKKLEGISLKGVKREVQSLYGEIPTPG